MATVRSALPSAASSTAGSLLARSLSRRTFLQASATMALATQLDRAQARVHAADEQPVEILHPRHRVPASFIIDDSTCLVNMGHFCMPQFATAWPEREAYMRPWKTWPREIPDAFVREFGEWCGEHGVKGKYSIVPNPACVGWLDRELPGWSRAELQASLKLVRDLMTPNWDIHPEMITHTRVIDLKTGRPIPEISAATMENSYPQQKLSVDQLAEYLAYALRILKNCDLPCEGITTPGGFGNAMKPELPAAVFQAVRDVFGAELPHYFKYVIEGPAESTLPKVEHVADLDTDHPRVVVNVPAGTGDWFGGWDGDRPSEGHRYANADATEGRMVELIKRNEPAVMLCHWPGLYSHGTKQGFHDFQKVITALETRFRDQVLWMKVSELGRYGAARALTRIGRDGNRTTFQAPVACPAFTVRLPRDAATPPVLTLSDAARTQKPLTETRDLRTLAPGQWFRDGERVIACFDLPKGRSTL